MTTVNGLHVEIVDVMDETKSSNFDASHLAVGDDDTTPQSSNVSLNNEVGRFAVTETEDRSNSIWTRTFVDTSQANGNTLKEVGLITESSGGTLLNHSIMQDVPKDNTTTVTIDVEIIFGHK